MSGQVISPGVKIHGIGGILLLALAFLIGHPGGVLGLLGLYGIVVAVGTAFTRWVYLTGPLAGLSADRASRWRLDNLQRQLSGDPDPRALESLRKLRQIRQRLDGSRKQDQVAPLLAEVRDKAEELYESCLGWLERAADQRTAAEQMATPDARQQLLQSRGQLLDEVVKSVDRLGASIDQIQLSALAQQAVPADLADIRNELDVGLEVARRVEERMHEFDRGLKGSERLE